jgi:hypothetical protein
MADKKVKTIRTCGDVRSFSGRATAKSAVSPTETAALTSAEVRVQQQAMHDALDRIAEYICPKRCPVRLVEITLPKPAFGPMDISHVQGGQTLDQVEGTIDWKASLGCSEIDDDNDDIDLMDVPAPRQYLPCGTKELMMRGALVAKGKGKTELAARDQAKTELTAELTGNSIGSICRSMSSSICRDKECQVMHFYVKLGDVKAEFGNPDSDGNITCTLTERYQVSVMCKDE